MAFSGDFTPVLAKHSIHFSLQDSLAIGVDRMQRNFEPMRRQVGAWREQQLSAAAAKLIIYCAFIEGELIAPRHLVARPSWPCHGRDARATSAFTSAFKELDPIPQFKATAKLGAFLS